MLSSAGIPPVNGFWSNLIIIIATIHAAFTNPNFLWIAGIAVLASIVSLFSFLKVLRYVFLGKPKTDHKDIFYGVMKLIEFLYILWNVNMIYIGLNEKRLSYLILGILGVLIEFIIILVVHGKLF